MATIRKRGFRWQVQVRRTGQPPLSRSFIQRSDAEAWARKQEVLQDQGEVIQVRRDLKAMKLDMLLERYEREITPLKRGSIPEKARIGVMRRHRIASTSLHLLTPSVLASYRDERLKAVSSGSVRREMTVLLHCLKTATTDWGIPLPFASLSTIKRPPDSKGRNRRLKADELPALKSALEQCRNTLVRQVFLFALATGMRRGELLNLEWPNVDWEDRTALLPLTKNGEARLVPLSPAAIQVLIELQKVRQQQPNESLDALVFPITANAFRLAWERLKRRAGVDDLRFHDLRHEAISRYFELGLSVPEVILISGHKDSRTLFRYTHLNPKDVAFKLSFGWKEDGT